MVSLMHSGVFSVFCSRDFAITPSPTPQPPPGLNICTEHVNCKKQTPTDGGELVQNFSSEPSIGVALYDVKHHKRQMEDLFIYSYYHHTIPIINFGVLIYLSPVFYHSRVY